MAVEINPAWEFWVPDPEIAEVMGVGERARTVFEFMADCPRTGMAILDGFRQTSNPNSVPSFRLGREKRGRQDLLPDRPCDGCRRLYTPKCRRSRCCSLDCRHRWAHPVDWGRVADMRRGGMKVAAIGRIVGRGVSLIRKKLKASGDWVPGTSGPARVLADAECQHCRKAFRPRQARQAKYCSRRCFHEGDRLKPKACEVCRTEFDPKRSKQKYCGYRCSGPAARRGFTISVDAVFRLRAEGHSAVRIAAELGVSAVGVRRVIRVNRDGRVKNGDGGHVGCGANEK